MIRIDDERGKIGASSSILFLWNFRCWEEMHEGRESPSCISFRVPGMVQVLRVKVPSRVFTAKCSEPQAEDSNV